MRALDTNMKADLIKQNKSTSPSNTLGDPSQQTGSSRPSSRRSKTDITVSRSEDKDNHIEEQASSKKARPRSLTFTRGKGDQSPSKKQKGDRSLSHGRNKSVELTRTSSSISLQDSANSSGFGFLGRAPKPAVPEDFISYLKEVQSPQSVEVGRLQKLRQLLRNETVSWVDEFITKDGMAELVGLLYRIIDIEWR